MKYMPIFQQLLFLLSLDISVFNILVYYNRVLREKL